MTHQQLEPFYCLWIHDLLESKFDPETRISTWGQLRLRRVDILGTVVSARTFEKRSEYNIDDGTGVIHCCYFHRDLPPAPTAAASSTAAAAAPAAASTRASDDTQLTRLTLGTRLHVRGGLQEFRESKQVVAYSLRVVTDPDEESARVFRLDALYRSVYAPDAAQ